MFKFSVWVVALLAGFLLTTNLVFASHNASPKLIKISGDIEGLSGQIIETCTEAVVSYERRPSRQKDKFSFEIEKGKSFCIRVPDVPGYLKEAENPRIEELNSYEGQVAGVNCKFRSVECLENEEEQDLSSDSSFDFEYKKVAPVDSPIPQPSAPVATNTSYQMKVLVLKYFPLTADKQNIDISVTGDVADPYSVIKQRTINITNNLKNALERATKYLGYKSLSAQSALTYQVVDTIEHENGVPFDPTTRRPQYFQILTDHNVCEYVNNQGVSEIWLWAYQGPSYPENPNAAYLSISESKMSGPYGDISNSYRGDDMPHCNKTYRLYVFNYGRGTAEALHSWSHQIESEIDAVNWDLFRNKFQGVNYPQTLGINGRCGSVHNPPNARSEYDYANSVFQKADCLSWDPNGIGTLSDISCHNWGCGDLSDDNNSQLNYLIWMWQNLPGRLNNKIYQGHQLRNFWDVHGNFDQIMGSDRTLFLN
jgi:hypothetical protein